MSAQPILARLSELSSPERLRLVLKVDAVVTGANGLAYVAAAGPLADLFGLSSDLLRAAGVFLLAFSACVWLVATRPAVPLGPVTAVIVANALWVAVSIQMAVADVSSPTAVGAVWIVMQALVVALFAWLQARFARDTR